MSPPDPEASTGLLAFADATILDALASEVVGRRRELEVVAAALDAGRHVLLEGPPGTGKSTMLHGLADAAGIGFEFVEGNAELTPTRLLGQFDPALVLSEGYVPDIFVDGPLASAVRNGRLLYVEEINRVPEETLNLLVTVMSEGVLAVPRLGRIPAAPGFRLVAAMNPFDAVGTARISGAVYDRVCRVAMGYQDAGDEAEIVRRHVRSVGNGDVGHGGIGHDMARRVVALVRATREHPDLRVGSSVRGAIDLLLVADRLGPLRGRTADDPDVSLDAALAALSGRIRLHEGTGREAEDVVRELWARFLAPREPEPDAGAGEGDEGARPGKARPPQTAGGPTT